jgi:carbon monoxide dehydrogenase subunit G
MTLTHRFSHPLDAVWAMLHDPASHVAKFTGMGHRDLEVVSTESTDTSLDVTIRRTVEMEVPAVARKLITPTNTVTSVDHWSRESDERLAGRYTVDIKGVPAETRGRTSVVADGPDACTYTIELSVKVKVPLIGEKVAGALKPQLTEQIEAEFAACDTWLAEH